MEDSSDSKVEETPNLEGIDQIKETIVEVVDSTKDVQDNGSFDNSISVEEEESVDEVVKEVDLEKPPEIIDVSETVGDPVVPDTSLYEQIEELEASVKNSVISDAKPGDNMNVESESLVETDNVTEEIQESSTASSYVNDSAAAIDAEDKELASLTSVDNETPGIEQNVELKETEGLSVQSLVDGNEASPTATDILETGLEVSKLLHTNDNGEIPPVEADLGAKGTEETQLQEVLDSSKKEPSGPFYIELEGNVDDASQATRANAPAVDSSNDDGNKAKTVEMAETKPDAVMFERKPCWASLLGCCGLSEAFHLSGR